MKIAIVCGHFIPSMGYVEVHFAKELAKQDHNVTVITSAAIPSYVEHIVNDELELGKESQDGYAIIRIPHSFSAGQMIKGKGLNKEITSLDPDLIIVIGLGKLFPEPVFKLSEKYKIATLLGDNAQSHTSKSLSQKIKGSVKNKVYKKAIQNSFRLFPYTRESIGIVADMVGDQLGKVAIDKSTEISLGFDTEKFYPSKEDRKTTREKYHIANDETVLITATRLVREKKLEEIVDLVDQRNTDGKPLKFILIGFLNDEYGDQLKQHIKSKTHSSQFIALPFMSSEEVRKHYCAADIGYFPIAAISIFEALGTGLPLILPKHKNIEHILNEANGLYSENNLSESLENILNLKTTGHFESREKMSKQNAAQFSYQSIVRNVLDNC